MHFKKREELLLSSRYDRGCPFFLIKNLGGQDKRGYATLGEIGLLFPVEFVI